MPTTVSAARQCLTQEAASALDEAVALARRRGHAQTTSFHMVSSLLSLPNSSLREACTRTRNNAYSTRVQFKALELSLSVSLDRLPSSQGGKAEEPPVSNSLMAAIKRSQANQRRQPENFSFYQQQQQQYSSCSSAPIVKVELPNLILSILDDPLVSRVFGEAGFRSYDIKMATLRPGHSFHAPHLFGYMSRYKRPNPPLFLCNLSGGDSSEVGSRCFSFPFMGCFGDENSRRIGEVLVRNKKRNPLLLGVAAGDALRSFLEILERKIEGVLPLGLSGLSVVCVKDEVLRFLNGDCDEGSLELRFEEVGRMVENGGVVVNFGDLKALAGDGVGIDCLRFLVGRFSRLLELHNRKLWLIGAVATYDVYFKFLNKFPSIEEDWDLEILPITSVRFSLGGSYPRSSLMESFVPLGGFFSMPSDTKSPLNSNTCRYVTRCTPCNEKCEEEIAALSKGGVCSSIAERCQSNSPSLLQTSEHSPHNGLASQAKDNKLLLTAKITELQNKWDSICLDHHQNQTLTKGYTHQLGHPHSRILGFQVDNDGKREASNHSSRNSNVSSTEEGNKNATSSLSIDLRQNSLLNGLRPLDMLSKAKNPSKSGKAPSELVGGRGDLKPHHFDSSSASINDGHTSPTSVTSVTTDLGLGLVSASTGKQMENSMNHLPVDDIGVSGFIPTNAGGFNSHSQSSLCQFLGNCWQSNVKDPKFLFKALVERVSRQEEAISTVVAAISRNSMRAMSMHTVGRRDIWMNFHGPDRLGKKKLGVALAEVLKGSTESLIYADLSFQDETTLMNTLFDRQFLNKYDVTMRGTLIDFLVEKLSKKPMIVFLENVDKADFVVQNHLTQALKTGRLMDLSGREANTSNCIFLMTTSSKGGCGKLSSRDESEPYYEEDILKAGGRLFQILIRFDLNDEPTNETVRSSDPIIKGCPDQILMNKRKLLGGCRRTDQSGSLEVTKRAHKASKSYLDLNNLPAEGSEICNTCSGDSDSDSSSDKSKSWLEDFDRKIDQIAVFEPFDFDTLAEKISKEMNECLCKIVGSNCSLEIEWKVMQQLLAAAYVFDCKRVEDWIEHVLKQGFLEAMGKFSLNDRSVVKLVTYEGGVSHEEQAQGFLPSRIIMN